MMRPAKKSVSLKKQISIASHSPFVSKKKSSSCKQQQQKKKKEHVHNWWDCLQRACFIEALCVFTIHSQSTLHLNLSAQFINGEVERSKKNKTRVTNRAAQCNIARERSEWAARP